MSQRRHIKREKTFQDRLAEEAQPFGKLLKNFLMAPPKNYCCVERDRPTPLPRSTIG
jgi:hypothetical protein